MLFCFSTPNFGVEIRPENDLQYVRLHSKFHQNRMISRRDTEKKNNFKMAAVRHVEFSKFAILVT